MDAESAAVIDRERFDAVVFDMDGVITDTARVHEAAWKRLFDDFLREREGEGFAPFSAEEYRSHVDGKPRYDGVRDFLASRGIALPEGSPDDAPGTPTVQGLGNRKNEYFLASLAEGVRPYPHGVAFVHRLQDAGFGTAIISASRNAAAVLEAAGLADLFAVRVDGVVAAELGLAGKPAPDVFVEAARRLGATPERTVVVEDALAGVEAGRAGGFGLVIGVDRAGQADALREHGADAVTSDLGALRVVGPPRPIAALPDALDTWPHVAERLRDARPAVFLDYDGTLTPIVERPEDAHLDPGMRAALRRLAAVAPVAIVSGRDVRFVIDEVDLPDVYYLGSHGFDVVAPEGTTLSTGREDEFRRFLPVLDDAEKSLADAASAIAGARIERKKYAIAVHYRQVAENDVPAVERVVDAELARRPLLRKSGGKKVFELRPDIDWDKGRAVRWALEALGLSAEDVLPVYLGDDLTDEDAFAEIASDGLGIVVGDGERTTRAAYRVSTTDEVGALLDRLAEAIERSRG